MRAFVGVRVCMRVCACRYLHVFVLCVVATCREHPPHAASHVGAVPLRRAAQTRCCFVSWIREGRERAASWRNWMAGKKYWKENDNFPANKTLGQFDLRSGRHASGAIVGRNCAAPDDPAAAALLTVDSPFGSIISVAGSSPAAPAPPYPSVCGFFTCSRSSICKRDEVARNVCTLL